MQKFIGDDLLTLSLQGLRWIDREDKSWANKESYAISFNYKGSDHKVEYKNKKDRDKMYERVRDALTAETKK